MHPPRHAEGLSELGTDSEHKGGSSPTATAPQPPKPKAPNSAAAVTLGKKEE